MSGEPRRTCVACREVRDKDHLVRLVRLPEGIVVVDAGGQALGRGAYVCPGRDCGARLVKGARLSQAFRRPSKLEPTLLAAIDSVTSSRR